MWSFFFLSSEQRNNMTKITKIMDLPSRELKEVFERRVVCAACKMTDGTILLGARHWDSQMHATAKRLSLALGLIGSYPWRMDGEVQGFIDQRGVFMDRAEAWEVALAAGQIRYIESWNHSAGKGGYILYSENLY